MSEVIVRMEMPKGCYECPMYDFAVYRGKPMLCCNAHFVLKSIPNNGNPRPSWCPIVGELPEEHGNLIDGDLAKARIHKNIIDYYENASGGYYLAEDAEEEVGLMVEYETIVPTTERSET